VNEDDDYSIEREFRREKHRRGDNKHGRGDNWAATKQARAIWRAYCELLTKIIAEDRLKRGRRDKTIWTALKIYRVRISPTGCCSLG
jgi:hypothetical protein